MLLQRNLKGPLTPLFALAWGFLLLCLLAGRVSGQPYIMTDHGLGKYGYLEKDIPTSFQYYRANSNTYDNISQMFIRVWKGSDYLMYGPAVNTCSGVFNVVQQTYPNPMLAGVTAGTVIYPSIHIDYCGGTNSYGGNPNQTGFLQRYQPVLDVAHVPADNATVLYNTATGTQNVVLGFIVQPGGLTGLSLNRLWLENTGSMQEGTNIPNAALKLYYESVTGTETYGGTEFNAVLSGNYAGNATNNNIYGDDALGISIPAAGLHCYVVLTSATSGCTLTAGLRIIEDGISIIPANDGSYSLMRMEATPATATAIPMEVQATATNTGPVCEGNSLTINGSAVGGAGPYSYAWAWPGGFPGVVATVTQDFNTLATSGNGNLWTDNNTIAGWYSSRVAYNATAGSVTSGGLYSFGSSSSSERALGSYGTASATPIYYGVKITNPTGSTVTALNVSYILEQWRVANGGGNQSLTVAYSTDATDLTTNTWTTVAGLQGNALITNAASSGGLDGNASANWVAVSGQITGLSIAPNASVWVRWADIDNPTSDHGLAIDDVSIGLVATTGSTADITFNPVPATATGTFSLTVTDANGCTGTATTAPSVPAQPAINPASNAPLCAGQTLNLSANAPTATSFAWTGPASYSATSADPSLVVGTANAGTYTLVATGANGCTATGTTAVVVYPAPTAAAVISGTPCAGNAITLTGTAGAGTSPYGYAWAGPASYSSTAQSPVLTPATTAMSGTYTLTVTDVNLCTASASASLTVNSTPSLSVTAPLVCAGATLTVTATPAGGTAPYATGWTATPAALPTTTTMYSQNFNGLFSSGYGTWTQNSILSGWYAAYETGDVAAPGDFLATDGSSTTSGMKNYGLSPSSDRSLGGLSGGTGNIAYGYVYQHTGSTTVTSVKVKYTGEQWRDDFTTTSPQSITLWYKTSTTPLTEADLTPGSNAGWTQASALTFTSPSNANLNGLDGNAPSYRQLLALTDIGFNGYLKPGEYLMLRWVDANEAGNDHGLAIDDVQVEFVQVANPIVIPSATTAAGGVYAASVTDANGCTGTGSVTAAVNSASGLAVPTAPGTYFATDRLPEAGYTHYCDCANGLILLSVNEGSWSPGTFITSGTPAAGQYAVRVDVQPNASGSRYINLTSTAGYRANVVSGQWVAINRTWDLLLGSTAQEPLAPVDVRTYFTDPEYQEVNSFLSMGAGPMSSVNWLNFYKLVNVTPPHAGALYPTSAAALADGHSQVGLANMLVYHNTPDHPNPWTYASFGANYSATMSIPSFSGGGGGGGGGGSVVLSLEWLELQAVASGDGIVLQGRVLAPEGVARYTISRSTDGLTFSELFSEPAIADGLFAAVDTDPATGRNLYRVYAEDANGQGAYSPVVEVLPASWQGCAVYPNPATDHLMVRYAGVYPAEKAELYDMAGRLVWATALADGQDVQRLPLEGIAKGVYTWRVTAGPDVWSGLLMKE